MTAGEASTPLPRSLFKFHKQKSAHCLVGVGRDAHEGEGEKPSMRWVSMVGSCPIEAQQQPKGRTIVRQDPNVAVGVSFSFTDTSAPTPGGNRR